MCQSVKVFRRTVLWNRFLHSVDENLGPFVTAGLALSDEQHRRRQRVERGTEESIGCILKSIQLVNQED
jgi:hypothetical protein